MPAFTLSIGCGSGLLEALILHNHPNLQITGIEVSASVNRYLAEENFDVVSGTWDLYARAPQAAAWMFVYPREPKLVSKYIEMYADDENGSESSVQMILWLGPRADWADYEPCFRNSSFSDVSIPGESMASWATRYRVYQFGRVSSTYSRLNSSEFVVIDVLELTLSFLQGFLLATMIGSWGLLLILRPTLLIARVQTRHSPSPVMHTAGFPRHSVSGATKTGGGLRAPCITCSESYA
ncbi:hypothetical protein An15g02520 [Aspergillus niger]|uniref:Methyltransferase domain-containing protein n=2 Tax=Aspergillus niger TaxID=5061 RepID=A2R532_ASPNC|nr:hypothetical protein An15g02520 [Aspergillus niger]CAL00406.1 hypothetical protein An15g02520 [Aspergillus niger]